ncbi:hypothetical protein GCM10009565_23440 [Amycolatopsis albidoflavus]
MSAKAVAPVPTAATSIVASTAKTRPPATAHERPEAAARVLPTAKASRAEPRTGVRSAASAPDTPDGVTDA